MANLHSPNSILIICMGVSGSGKSTLARRLASQLDYQFLEADDFHPTENVEHMASGKALTDAMREPWIESMCQTISLHWNQKQPCVLAYSGLRKAHRARFRALHGRVIFLHLHGDKQVIAGRMQKRSDHFMPTTLLDSQFADLDSTEGETDVHLLDIRLDPNDILLQASALCTQLLNDEKYSPK